MTQTEERIQPLISLGLKYSSQEDAYIREDIYVPLLDIQTSADDEYTELCNGIKAHIEAHPDQYPPIENGLATIRAPSEEHEEETIIGKALSTLRSGSQTLQSNQVSTAAARQAAQQLLDKIKAAGSRLTPELFDETTGLLKKMAVTVKTQNERRKPFTQAMDLIKAEFTSCENQLKESVAGTEAYELKQFADDYVKQCALEKKRQEEEAERQRQKNQEKIDRKAAIESNLAAYFNEYLAMKKQVFNNRFNAITLETYENECRFFTTVTFAYAREHFDLFKYNAPSRLLTPEEQQEILQQVLTDEKFATLSNEYFNAMIGLRVEKVDLLASKKNELERIREFEIEQEKERQEMARIEQERKTADEARKKELEAQERKLAEERRVREEEERKLAEERRVREEEERKLAEEQNRKMLADAQAAANTKAAQETTANLFAAQASLSNVTTPAPKTRTGYEIEVKTPLAWLEVFNFWFQNEGAGWNDEKMRKKFDFMLSSMEKLALKNGTQLVSDNIIYHETYTAKK